MRLSRAIGGGSHPSGFVAHQNCNFLKPQNDTTFIGWITHIGFGQSLLLISSFEASYEKTGKTVFVYFAPRTKRQKQYCACVIIGVISVEEANQSFIQNSINIFLLLLCSVWLLSHIRYSIKMNCIVSMQILKKRLES